MVTDHFLDSLPDVTTFIREGIIMSQDQLVNLNKQIKRHNLYTYVVHLDVPLETLQTRLDLRARYDDQINLIQKKLAAYPQKQTYLKDISNLIDIKYVDAEQDPDLIIKDVLSFLLEDKII